MVRLRKKRASPPPVASVSTEEPGSDSIMAGTDGLHVGGSKSWSVRTQWMFFALASGACAAFNGVFAKLTTTDLTTSLSKGIAETFGLSSIEDIVEYVVRGMFFALNLIFNGVMWSLFTTALARGTSTTQVSIMNTSANFILTAFMGSIIFSEALPPMWWAGAALLVAGNVIIGRKDESNDAGQEGAVATDGYAPVPRAEEDGARDAARKDDEDEDVIDLGDLGEEKK